MISSGCCLFGIGSACLLDGLTGAVAIGRSTIVSLCVVELASAWCVCSCVVDGACTVSSVVCVSVVVRSFVDAGLAGISIVGCNTSVGVSGVQGAALMMSINCLSYLSGSIWRRIVLVLMTLPCMPMIDALVIESLPSQIPL